MGNLPYMPPHPGAGALPEEAVEDLREHLDDLQEAIDQVEAGEVTAIHGGTP